MTLRDQLLMVARTYCEAKRLSASRVSTLVFNDGKKLGLLENGKQLFTDKYEHAMKWFSDNWPEDTPWPAGVQRPTEKAAA